MEPPTFHDPKRDQLKEASGGWSAALGTGEGDKDWSGHSQNWSLTVVSPFLLYGLHLHLPSQTAGAIYPNFGQENMGRIAACSDLLRDSLHCLFLHHTAGNRFKEGSGR